MDTLGLRAASLATYVTKIMTRVASPSSFDTGGAPRVQAAELCGDTVRLLGRNRAMERADEAPQYLLRDRDQIDGTSFCQRTKRRDPQLAGTRVCLQSLTTGS